MEREELPPPEYQELLPWVLREKFPAADPKLVEHAVPLVAAFGTTSVYATNFGIARFHLAQHRVKLVGEYVGRGGRSPNPEIIRAIQKWPPINTLRGWQAFLGTAHDIRAHAGPTSAHITVPLRPLLKPGGISPNAEPLAAIEAIKELLIEDHLFAVPDEATALISTNAWLADDPRPSSAQDGAPTRLATPSASSPANVRKTRGSCGCC